MKFELFTRKTLDRERVEAYKKGYYAGSMDAIETAYKRLEAKVGKAHPMVEILWTTLQVIEDMRRKK